MDLNFLAVLSVIGSDVYTPSTLVALRMTSAPISRALWAAAVSVVKKGQPMPAEKMMIRRFSRWRMTRRRMNGSATDLISIDETWRGGGPGFSRGGCGATPLTTQTT